MTTAFTDAAVSAHRYPRFRNLCNAATRGSLLLDLAAARLVIERDGRLHASVAQSGFSPADALLASIAKDDGAELAPLVRRGPVGMDDVIAEFVAQRWWHQLPRRPWHLRARHRPAPLLTVDTRDASVAEICDLMMRLFSAATDTDDLEAEASQIDFAAATWLVPPVVHQLIELRLWFEAVVTTHPSSAS